MKKIIALGMIAFAGSAGFSQEMPQVVAPSPEAAALGKYVEMPVSHYTGIPAISVPICSISGGEINVPVSLSYHAKGIQVSEMASRTGLGWTLNAGGAITRQVRGNRPDEYGYLREDFTSTFFTTESTRLSQAASDINGEEDFDPDLYMFNFMGFSGKFIIEQTNRKPLQQQSSDLKIEPVFDANAVRMFIVTDTRGIKYYFGLSKDGSRSAKDKPSSTQNFKFSSNSTGHEQLPPSTYLAENAWYLMEIETPNREKVQFYYEPETLTYYTRGTDGMAGTTAFSTFSRNVTLQHQLQRVVSSEGTIFFNKNTSAPREDVQGGSTLQSIVVADRYGVQRKKFAFSYAYTEGPAGNTLSVLSVEDPKARKRLFLTGIREINDSDTQELSHLFEYNPIVLPGRHSNSQDNWGYYNSRPNGLFLVNPVSGVDRKVNIEASEAGMLQKITYPTGGYTLFEYEHNRTLVPQKFKNLAIPENNPTAGRTFGILKNPDFYENGAYKKPVTIAGNGIVTVNANTQFTTTGCNAPEYNNSGCMYSIYLTNADGSIVAQFRYGQRSVPLPAGSYFVKVVINSPANHHVGAFIEAEEFSVVLKWSEPVIDESATLFGAGKRIKKISFGDASGIASTKEYIYTDDSQKSTGRLFAMPGYFQKFTALPGGGFESGGSIDGTHAPQAMFNNGQLGYAKVTEIRTGGENAGKTEYFFTVYEDTGEFYKYPYHLPNDMEWARGMPLGINYFGYINGGYRLLKKIENKYVYGNNSTLPPGYTDPAVIEVPDPLDATTDHYLLSLKKSRVPIIRFGRYLTSLNTQISHNTYRLAYYYAGRIDLAETRETENFYYSNGNLQNTMVAQNFYNHDSYSHLQATSQRKQLSQTEYIETRFFYPQDPEMSSEPCVADLKAMHILSPLLVQQFRNSSKISEQKTRYRNWTSGLIAPETVQSSKGTEALETKIRYSAVDPSNGKPLEIQQEDGMKTCYVWGYGKTLPVAKIENIAYSAIPANLVAAVQAASDAVPYSEQNLVNALEALRASAPLASAAFSGYTHKPMLGISTMIDAKGLKASYHYDSFGRLETVRDNEGNILSQNEYHYKNQ